MQWYVIWTRTGDTPGLSVFDTKAAAEAFMDERSWESMVSDLPGTQVKFTVVYGVDWTVRTTKGRDGEDRHELTDVK